MGLQFRKENMHHKELYKTKIPGLLFLNVIFKELKIIRKINVNIYILFIRK